MNTAKMALILVLGGLGGTHCIDFKDKPSVLGIKKIVEDRFGIPVEDQVLSCNGRCLNDAALTGEWTKLPPLRVGLRLLGGKGGFGSLLRGGNTRVGQKKTTNFDACRDLSGRRLRHANNEKRLAQWYEEEKERELAQLGEKHVKSIVAQHTFDETAFTEELNKLNDDVVASVQVGLNNTVETRPIDASSRCALEYYEEESEEQTVEASVAKQANDEQNEKAEKDDAEEEIKIVQQGKRKREKEKSEEKATDKTKKVSVEKVKVALKEGRNTSVKKRKLPPPPTWAIAT